MKQCIVFFVGIFLLPMIFSTKAFTQSVAINTDASLPNASAILDVKSSTKGLLIPRTSIGGAVDWSILSDGRYKQQVQEDVKGLEFISLLRPITYTIDLPGLDNYYNKNKAETNDTLTDMKQ